MYWFYIIYVKSKNYQYKSIFCIFVHFFYRGVEILTDRYYTLGAKFAYIDETVFSPNGDDLLIHPVETVWGGEGEQYVSSVECKTGFHFEKIYRENIRSSWANGQIPLLYYI